ncbi:BTB/POZ domain-containing protein 6-A-like isoform X2 [Periplaneta americana]|uniref:BTB/POZ domain-containing protein 6-A-like isoform X2 n=1 Tax=Periplaneta americana TaxID=6978 RepID=UPI0037E9A756
MAVAIANGNLQEDWQLSKECVRDRIQTLLHTSQWSDCTFQIFKAHKLILASCSPVFEAMCFGPLAEKQCINVDDVEPDVFRILLQYIYTDSIKLSSVEEAGGVLYASKKYMLPHLSRMCRNYLLSNIRPSNVLAIFEFAEGIQETELLEPCMEVMRKYTEDVLQTPCDHISPSTLVTLLDQTALNMSESELFEAVLHWAEAECLQLGMQPTAANRRTVLVKAGALSRIRFLVLSLQEFAAGPEISGVLTSEEVGALRLALENGEVALPPGMNHSARPRGRVAVKHFYCARRFLKTAVTVSGRLRLLTKVQADHSVMVSGVRVFTRLVPQREFAHAPSFPRDYRENMEVSVLDQQGAMLCRTVFTELVEYNTLATVSLSEPVRFVANKEYSILLVLPSSGDRTHEYPLSFVSQTEKSHGVEFRFCDHADINGTGAFVRRLDMGFVDAVVFSM